jgi:hypothetical protein
MSLAPALNDEIDEQLRSVLAADAGNGDLLAILEHNEVVKSAMPVLSYGAIDVNTYRFALGGNIEARL